MPYRRAGGGGSSSSSGGGTLTSGALLREFGHTDRGLHISHNDSTLGWHLRGIQRQLEEPEVPATLLFENQDQDATLSWQLPADWLIDAADQNNLTIDYTRYPDPLPQARASATYGPLLIQAAVNGAVGNGYVYQVIAGTPEVLVQNALAQATTARRANPQPRLAFRSPNGIAAAASVTARWTGAGDSARTLVFTSPTVGAAGNGIVIEFGYQGLLMGTNVVTSAYVSATRLLVSLKGSVNNGQIIDAVNAARWQGDQLVVASLGAGNARNQGALINSNADLSSSTSFSLSGGGTATTGAGTNTGAVHVTTGAARTDPTPAVNPTATIRGLDVSNSNSEIDGIVVTHPQAGTIANTRRVVITAGRATTPALHAMIDIPLLGGATNGLRYMHVNNGPAGNNVNVSFAYDAGVTSGTVTATWTSATQLNIRANGAITAGNIRTAVDASRYTGNQILSFVEYYGGINANSASTWRSVTPSFTGTTSGGANADNTRSPLAAVVDGFGNITVTGVLSTDTLTDIITIIAATDEYSASTVVLASGAVGTDLIRVPATFGNTHTYTFAGGVDTVPGSNPLTAAWDEPTHTLTITALSTDTLANVIAVVAALDEFQAGDGTTAGDVYVVNGAVAATDTLDVQPTVGASFVYNFAGGVDAVDRTPLATADNFLSSLRFQLRITGVLATDTVQDLIDTYSGANFLLSANTGSTTADTLPGTEVRNNRNLTGGRDAVLRQNPAAAVAMADDGTISISLHAVDDDTTNNTTLAELFAAIQNTPYGREGGGSNSVAAASLTVDLTGGGAGEDPIRNQSLPTSPSGGINFIPADPIAARVIDTGNEPRIEVEYSNTSAQRDTLQEILTALDTEGNVTAVSVYGTDLTAVAEVPPFNRSMFGDGPRAERIAFEDVTYSSFTNAADEEFDFTIAAATTAEVVIGGGSPEIITAVDNVNNTITLAGPGLYVATLSGIGNPSHPNAAHFDIIIEQDTPAATHFLYSTASTSGTRSLNTAQLVFLTGIETVTLRIVAHTIPTTRNIVFTNVALTIASLGAW